MPKHPLFQDHAIALSVTLAATIGLEDAVILTLLNDAARIQNNSVTKLSNESLRELMPFWNDTMIRNRLRSLSDKGLIFITGALFPDASEILFCFEEPNTQKTRDLSRSNIKPTQALPEQWQPAEEALQRLEQHGIPRAFSCNQLDAFVLQGREQGESYNDWNNRFFRYVKKQWVYTQNDASRFKRIQESSANNQSIKNQANNQETYERTAFRPTKIEAEKITHQWQPSEDAVAILQRADIDHEFIMDAIPEFILYWSDRGEAHKTWNSKFIHHVRQQWVRFTTAVEHSSLPTRIENGWQPAEDCYDILQMGHIPKEFAHSLIAEFVLYWRDSNQVHNSWNSRFLQYVKQQWGKGLAQHTGGSHEQQSNHQPGYSTAEASRKRLQDTNW